MIGRDLNSNGKLLTIDINSGTVTATNLPNGELSHIEFNNSNNTLYGISEISGQYHIVSVDPQNGSSQSIASLDTQWEYIWQNGDFSTFDDAGNLIMIGRDLNSNGKLLTIDINSGNVTATNLPNGELTHIEYINNISNSTKEIFTKTQDIIYPNPITYKTEFISIKPDNKSKNPKYRIYTSLGVQLDEGSIINGRINNILSLKNGVYFVEIQKEEKSKSIVKLIVKK